MIAPGKTGAVALRYFLLIMLAAAPASAQEPVTDAPFCTDLRQIVAAANEVPPFASLKRDHDAEWLGVAAHCHRVTSGADSFYCRVWTRGAPDGRPGLADRVQACLPTAAREFDDPDSRNHWDRRITRLRSGELVVDVEEHGGPGVHIGWYYSVEVNAAAD